ncbi:hypothetical protein KBD45_06415 [Candidatus Dojkabacteria bacterium]|nr:hypothetical protein [Candidatus Dojkabacteria bacterium]
MLNFRTNVLGMEPEEAIHDVDIAFQRANMSGDARHLIGEDLLRYLAEKRIDGSNQNDNNSN